MSLATDHFNDAELTSIAMEIIKDLGTKPQIDHSDPFICELAEEIEKDIFSHSHSSKMDSRSSFYTDPSLYFSSNSSLITDTDSQIKDRLKVAPEIVSRCQLRLNDSFNHSLPPLPPSSPKGKSVRIRRKLSPKTRFKSPMCPPPNKETTTLQPAVSSACAELDSIVDAAIVLPSNNTDIYISSYISPRNRQTRARVSSIPDFSTKSPAKQRIAPKIFIPNKNKRENARQRSKSAKQKHQTHTPPVHKKNKRRYKSYNARKTRANSLEFIVAKNTNSPFNEYAVEVNDGFIFIKF